MTLAATVAPGAQTTDRQPLVGEALLAAEVFAGQLHEDLAQLGLIEAGLRAIGAIPSADSRSALASHHCAAPACAAEPRVLPG